METELTCFEVETLYKSGRKRTEVIASESEEKMWEYYNKHYSPILIESAIITDVWPA